MNEKDIQALPLEQRVKLLEALYIDSPVRAHELIVSGIKHGVHRLLAKGLNARRLIQLGYSQASMRKLGCDEVRLEQLGYEVAAEARPMPAARAAVPVREGSPATIAQQIRALLSQGARALELNAYGYPLDAVRRVGLTAGELAHLGYALPELATVCSAAELRRAGFGPRDLRRFFGDADLVGAGFGASELRIAGYSIRDLGRMGFNDNQIRTAGFSNGELMNEGLTRTTRV